MDIIKKIIGTIKSRDKPNDNISDNRHRYITGILSSGMYANSDIA